MKYTPLAQQLRPQSFDEVAGHPQLVSTMQRIVTGGRPLSLLLWGPPGCGKTTLARLYAQGFDARFVAFSGAFSGTADLKALIQETQKQPLLRQQVIVFVDEIHRFNKTQQDAFLPFIEDGTIVLIGATTENPSFALNDALLSRLRVLTLSSLAPEALEQILIRYEKKYGSLPLDSEGRKALIEWAHGDGRHLLNMLESLQLDRPISTAELADLIQKRSPLYDRKGEGHYNLISALHKSVRGSDPDAALYWLCRMLTGGEDPQFIARRIVRMAVEDVGLADPQALDIALSSWKAYDQLGSPEGDLALAQAIIYLALCPKSNTLYTAYGEAKAQAEATSHLSPPKVILNAPTKLMKDLSYGKGYQYDHDLPHAFSGQNYFPDGMDRPSYYHPVERGFEREMKKRLDYFTKLREKLFTTKD